MKLRRARDHDRVRVSEIVEIESPGGRRGDGGGACRHWISDLHVRTKSSKVGGVAAADRTGTDHQHLQCAALRQRFAEGSAPQRNHGLRNTASTGGPVRRARGSASEERAANASAKASSVWSMSRTVCRCEMNIDPLNNTPRSMRNCCTRLLWINSSAPGNETMVRSGSPL